MGSKKKSTKMSLTEFLADQSTGSWADEMEDLPSAPAAAFSDYGDHDDRQKSGFGDRRPGFTDRRTYSRDSRYEPRDSPREARFSSRPERIPQELPTSPPYTAHLGNLPFDLTEEQVKKFFYESKILTIRILRDKESDRSKGFGYVEFEDLESLTKALQLSGENLGKRTVRISVADPPREREDRTAGEWRRIMPREAPSPRSDRFGSNDKFGHKEDKWGERSGGFRDRNDRIDRGERDRGDRFDRMDRSIERNDRGGNDKLERKGDTEWRGGGFNNSRSSSFRERRPEERFGNHHNSVRKYDMRPSPESKAENSNIRAVTTDTGTSPPMRKKLELKPRSSTAVSNENVAARSSKPNPFGEAKPIDTDEALRRVEERRKQKEKEQKEKEEMEKPTTSKNGNNTTITTENGDA